MRTRVEGVLAVLFVLVMLLVGSVVVWLAVTAPMAPIHPDATKVPSATTAARTDGYTGPITDARRMAREMAAGDDVPGLSVAVAVDGEVVWSEGFGWVGFEQRTPVTPETQFRLGALSKPITAVGAAVLVKQGRLDLDAPVQAYVPAYPTKRWVVTTRQLLGDVAGIHRIRGDNNDAMPDQHCEGLDEGVALLIDDPLQFEPGTQHRYSIWGWVLVSSAVQGAAKVPFARFMKAEVFAPLGMTRTIVEESSERANAHPARVPRSVMRRRLGTEDAPPPDYSCLAGGGAFLSTPTDLVHLGSAMLKPGLLNAETIETFRMPTRLTSGSPTTYALGWTVGSIELAGRPTQMLSHRGSPRGGSVSLLTFPEYGLAVAVAANAGRVNDVDLLAQRVARAFVTPVAARQPRATSQPAS